jgi:hypothetical protein
VILAPRLVSGLGQSGWGGWSRSALTLLAAPPHARLTVVGAAGCRPRTRSRGARIRSAGHARIRQARGW